MKIACLCGKTIGYHVAGFLLEQEHETVFAVNDYERLGEWYRTPRELPVREVDLAGIEAFGPDLIIVAFYDRILKEPLISLPRLGAWNLHLGDAERYRGAYPNVWALRNGDPDYSVTLHRIDAGIDTGPILAKKTFLLPPDFTGRDLYDAMTSAGFELLRESFPRLISGDALSGVRNQKTEGVVTHYRKELSRELVVTEDFKNAVRAVTFPPFPPPHFFIGCRKFVVTEAVKSA